LLSLGIFNNGVAWRFALLARAGRAFGGVSAVGAPFFGLVWFGFGFGFGFAFAGIRDMPSCFRRCPCAGRHLLSLPPQRK
jgi:hypothetical protein